jgi:uncharacterized protein (DUF486 family)
MIALADADAPPYAADMLTAILLTISNIFMTFAWYGHLKKAETWPMWVAIVVSWGIAFFEYCFQVPANRIGFRHGLDPTKLKIMQEAITLVVFVIFVKLYFQGEPMRWNYWLGFGLVMAAVFVVFHKWGDERPTVTPPGKTVAIATADERK